MLEEGETQSDKNRHMMVRVTIKENSGLRTVSSLKVAFHVLSRKFGMAFRDDRSNLQREISGPCWRHRGPGRGWGVMEGLGKTLGKHYLFEQLFKGNTFRSEPAEMAREKPGRQ